MHVISSLKFCSSFNSFKFNSLVNRINRQNYFNFFRGTRNGRPFTGRKRATLFPEKTIFETPREGFMFIGLSRSILFTAGFCSTIYITSSICEYEKIKNKFKSRDFSNWVAERWNSADGWDNKSGNFRKQLNKWWNSMPDGLKVFWTIFLLNAIVFGCWQVPALRSTMTRYFCSTPAAKAVCWPILLSSFSHYTILHFGMNMYVLHSFSSHIGELLGKEHMVAFYLSGAMISGLMAQMHKVALRTINPSLGASGAIMAILAYFCVKNPDAQLGIAFIPGFSFSAENAIKGVMALDAAGILFRWKLFDHAAHLGGALFGIFYSYKGEMLLWGNRDYVNKIWELFRQKFIGPN